MMVLNRDLLLLLFNFDSLLLEATPPLVLPFLTVGRIRKTVLLLGSDLKVIWDIRAGFWSRDRVFCESGVR